MTDLHARLRAAICCPSGVCCSPGDCYATDRSRSQLVDIDQAARAVAALLREEWRKQAGPYSRTTHLPGSGWVSSGFPAPAGIPTPESVDDALSGPKKEVGV